MNVLEEILKLPREERIKLVETIWDIIEQETDDSPLTDELRLAHRASDMQFSTTSVESQLWLQIMSY